MNMYGSGMNPRMYNHFMHVANEMNNYVAASSQRYYQQQRYRPRHDRASYLPVYQRPSLAHAGGVGGLFAYGLYALGLPTSVVHLGYRFGYFIDMNV